ncbi:MAG: Fe-S cluster assembly protein SufD, partial [Steroidobacter sp.]
AIKLGRHSRLTLIESYRSANESSHFNNVVTNIALGENAQLEHCRLQDENRASFHVSNINATVGKHARYINHHFNIGGSLGRLDLNVQLQGADAYAELNGLQFAVGNQVLDTHSRVEHCVAHARSSETYHGIADERGQVVFNGKVMVHKHAIGTDAQQSSRNLLLSPKAEIDTKPELEIYADDVKCAHGATVGQLDSTALFYLRSRGIGEQDARALLTLAFADVVINKVPLDSLRKELTRQVHARFGNKAEHAS